MKHYKWIRGGTLLFTFSKPPEPEGKAVALDDPALPDEVIEIDPDADAFPQSDEA